MYWNDCLYWIMVLLCLVVLAFTGCKNISINTETTTTFPDGKVVYEKRTETDSSFTLGLSDGPGKTLVGGNLLDINANGVSL